MSVSLTQLEYIVAVDNYKHFAKAAEKCLITQPTLSMQIKKMEEELGILIFDRSRQPVITTEIGQKIVEQSRTILREAGKLEELVKLQNQNITGILNIGIIPTLAPYLLPLILGKIIQKYPGLRLNIREKMTHEIITLLKKDELDVGILSTPTHDNQVKEDPIFYEEIKVYCDAKHSFTEKSFLEPEDLLQPGLWMLTEGNCFRSQVINLCSLPSEGLFAGKLQYESGSLETLKKMVETEGGFTLLPELAIMDMPARNLRQIKSLHPVSLREIGLVYVRNAAKKELFEILKEEIRATVPEIMLDKRRGKLVEWK